MPLLIPYARQEISEGDCEAVLSVLRAEYLTQGPVVPQFEDAVATYCSVPHAVAVNSATSALHIACLALGLGRGDWLWTSPNTFVASANCALYCGAKVDFVDIDSRTYNLCARKLEEKLLKAEKNGTLPKIVVPVHFAGQSCDMSAIHTLGKKYGFKIIEDASHAIGASYHSNKVGSCAHSDITVFSFHPVKIITSGEGGMAMTKSKVLAEQMRRFRAHGITSEGESMQPRPNHEIWNYQQFELGFNYRMTDIHAALGLSQMARLDQFVESRNAVARRYDNGLSRLPLILPKQDNGRHSSYHLYPIRINSSNTSKTQRQVYDGLRAGGVQANLHYIPVYRQPFYETLGFRAGYCSNAEEFFRSAISIPMFASLTKSNQDKVIKVLNSIFDDHSSE